MTTPPPSVIEPVQLGEIVSLAISAPPGDIVEVGVYRGGSAWWLERVALAQGRALHLFDTFTGAPELSKVDPPPLAMDFTDGDPSAVRAAVPSALVHVGRFPDTLPVAIEQGLRLGNVAFVHVDCDTYQAYRACIDTLWPLMVPGGIMVFDDYPYLAGAKKAVEESHGLTLTVGAHRSYAVHP